MVDVLDIDKAKYDKLLRRVGKRAASRNTVAHDQFQPKDEGNGVRFVIVKAKGLYGTPSAAWTEKRFEREGCLLDGIKAQLIEFNEVLGKSPIQRSGRDSNLCLDTLSRLARAHATHILASALQFPEPPVYSPSS
jgi:hypothetical protein